MRKNSELRRLRDSVMDNGIARLSYTVSDVHDIIHPFSAEGEELLTPEFLAFVERNRTVIPGKVPIELEIQGRLTDAEKDLIDRTIWENFCMHLSKADMTVKTCAWKNLLFLLYTILSTFLLFAVKNVTQELVVNLAYIPFYFFGYRLLIPLALDSIPQWKERNWYRQLASMKLRFSEEGTVPRENTTEMKKDKIISEALGYRKDADQEVRGVYKDLEAFRKNGVMRLNCKVESLEDVVRPSFIRGKEDLSDGITAMLEQVEFFFQPDIDMALTIGGRHFTDAERKRIGNAVREHYAFRIADGEKERSINRWRILLFLTSVIVSAVVLVLWGTSLDVALHELILMLFWFFADYSLEFILITTSSLAKKRRILEKCRDMKLNFPDRNMNNGSLEA